MKRKITFLLLTVLLCTLFAGCAKKEEKGRVYYLNFKPEQDAAWQELAKEYTEETGVEVVVSAGNNRRDVERAYPANLDFCVAVSGIDPKYELASFSNYGENISYCAPSTYVKSSALSYIMKGTSFAVFL